MVKSKNKFVVHNKRICRHAKRKAEGRADSWQGKLLLFTFAAGERNVIKFAFDGGARSGGDE